jgi:ABC-type dipeptide/oligopeptide/nickel transport system permease subunit
VTPRWKARVGPALLLSLALLSAGYGLLARAPGMPACPFGDDVELPLQTVCGRALGGLWRSVGLGLAAGTLACAVALGLALFARRFGGVVDALVEKGAELFFAVPDVLVLVALGVVVQVARGGEDGVPLILMVLSLTAVGWAAPTRQIQDRLRSLERQEFVQAAQAVGVTRWRLLRRHLLPFAWDYLLAIFLLRVPAIVLTESTISFLGFGLPPSEPSLGKYLGTNYGKLLLGEWRVVAPAWALLVLVVVAFQWTGQGLLSRADARAR